MPSSWRNSQPFHELELLRLHCIFMLGIQSYAPQPDDQLSYHITSLEESAASTTQRYACMHVWMNEWTNDLYELYELYELYLWMYVCVYVCMCVSVYMCVCLYLCLYVCVSVCMCLSMHACVRACMDGWTDGGMAGCMYMDYGLWIIVHLHPHP